MKKTYEAPKSVEFAFATEGMIAASQIGKGNGQIDAGQALSERNDSPWSSDNWTEE